jgi:hypothetical protein
MCEGIVEELHGIDLGDRRLNKRAVTVAEQLAAQPQASINAACGGFSETVAAYRFFDNDKVQPDKILQPHVDTTRRRIAQQDVVLVVQDTTELDLSDHPPKDARCLDREDRFGLYDHTHLAVTPQQLCLGVVGSEQFDREPESLGRAKERERRPIEEKESFRWLCGYRLASDLAGECPDTQIVSVADCEADIDDVFLEVEKHPTPADFVIRAKENRSTPERDPEGGPYSYRKIFDQVRASDVRMIKTIPLERTPKREARQAELHIRAMRVTAKSPANRPTLPTVTYNIVLVEEVGGPGDETDVCWPLMTTLPIDSVEDIFRVIDYYRTRWLIEVYFRTLKTGCRVEEIQLETVARLRNCLAFYKIIAWRVMYLTHLNRECPDLPCTSVFDQSEWKSVWRIATRRELPERPPTLSEFMPMLAGLGGYNNRASDPPPGPQAIWTGLRRMTDFALAWVAFGPETKT